MLSLPTPWNRACSELCSEHWVPGLEATLGVQTSPLSFVCVAQFYTGAISATGAGAWRPLRRFAGVQSGMGAPDHHQNQF